MVRGRNTVTALFAMLLVACGARATAPSDTIESAVVPAHESRDPRPAIPSIEPAADDAGVRALPGADRVVARLRPKLRACYRGVRDDPKQRGRVVLATKIAPDGTVVSVTPFPDSLQPKLLACLTDVVKSASFGATGGSGASMQIPVGGEPRRR